MNHLENLISLLRYTNSNIREEFCELIYKYEILYDLVVNVCEKHYNNVCVYKDNDVFVIAIMQDENESIDEEIEYKINRILNEKVNTNNKSIVRVWIVPQMKPS